MERVKSSDVLDVTHESKRAFRGEVLGYFRRLGSNSWDDYQFVRAPRKVQSNDADSAEIRESDATAELEVLPHVPLQLESRGTEVRVRSGGRVLRLRWIPTSPDLEALGEEPERRDVRQYFVENYLAPRGAELRMGAGALVARKLNES